MTHDARSNPSVWHRRRLPWEPVWPGMVVLAIGALIGAVVFSTPAQAQSETNWNQSPDPAAPYGHCQIDDSAFGNKLDAISYVGQGAEGVIAIKVLSCTPYTYGGWTTVPCPAGSAYDLCPHTGNDGLGNRVTFGVLRLGPKSDPNAPVTGCPGGTAAAPKLAVVQAAGRDPRRLSGIVTLSCATAAATAPATARMQAKVVPCSGSGHPYTYCVATPNDGTGHAVWLGVVGAHSPSDPYALYGECNVEFDPGFMSKASVLQSLGLPLEHVRGIDILACAVGWGFGPGFPTELHTGPCDSSPFAASPAQALRHDYCVWGTDSHRNGISFGVNGK